MTEFRKWLRHRGYSAKTADGYVYGARRWLKSMDYEDEPVNADMLRELWELQGLGLKQGAPERWYVRWRLSELEPDQLPPPGKGSKRGRL